MENHIDYSQIAKRDRHAVEQLVQEYSDMVFRTCLAYVQHEYIAEDLTQDVFIKVLERIDKFKGNSQLSTWIIRIAINLSLNYLRDNKKYLTQLEISGIEIEEASQDSKNERQIKKAVRQAIYQLPEKQRKVFILSFYLKLSYKEIAEITDLSISSIESLLFRSRKTLKGLLYGFYEEYVN